MASKGFDLDSYETVKQRKKRFFDQFPDGRIIPEIQNNDILEHILIKTTIYKNREDQEKGLIFSVGYAHELRDKEMSVTQYGKKYASVNYNSWIENCEESSVGRALDNAGFASNLKCSYEEMLKVATVSENAEKKEEEKQPREVSKEKFEPRKISEKRVKFIQVLISKSGITEETKKKALLRFGIESTKDLQPKQATELIKWLEGLIEKIEETSEKAEELKKELEANEMKEALANQVE